MEVNMKLILKMSKRLNIKYNDFINESLHMKDIDKIIRNISHVSPVASLLVVLLDTDIYDDDSPVNFLSLSNKINTLNYIPVNRRSSNAKVNNEPLIEMRIGRIVKKILTDVDKSKFSFSYKGKISYEREDDGIISFSNNLTGGNFARTILSAPCTLYNKRSDVSTSVDIKLENGKSYSSEVLIFMDDKYKSDWDDSSVYFRIVLSDTPPIDTGIYECELSFSTKFCGKTIYEINDADIEKFVNIMSAELKMIVASDDTKIEVVKGEDIRKWYSSENYQPNHGQLGSSCMSGKDCSKFFDIYTENPEVVSMLILKNSEGKLIGRALLWKLIGGEFFMDRVYCATEYDERIFIKYANENGYYYRSNGSNSNINFFFNGVDVTKSFRSKVVSDLSKGGGTNFKYYPYVDTLTYLDDNRDILFYENGNNPMARNIYPWKILDDTEGGWSLLDDDD